jgi:hypothetical protein
VSPILPSSFVAGSALAAPSAAAAISKTISANTTIRFFIFLPSLSNEFLGTLRFDSFSRREFLGTLLNYSFISTNATPYPSAQASVVPSAWA